MQLSRSLRRPLQKWLLAQAMMLGLLSATAQDRGKQDPSEANDTITVQRARTNGVQVSGKITNAATGKPLGAIRITYQDYSAAISDSLGNFRLTVPNYNVSIVLEGEGYQFKEVALRGRATVSAALYEDTYTSFYDATMLPFGSKPGNTVPFAA